MYKSPLFLFYVAIRGERYASRSSVLKGDDMYQGGERYASSAKRECHIYIIP